MKNTCGSCEYLWEAKSDEDPCNDCVKYSHWTAVTDIPSANDAKDKPCKADQGKHHMGYNERKAVYIDAIERWGSHAQTLMAIEEMGELTNALCKFRRKRCSFSDVAEEIADVTIMMEQLRLIFDVNEEVSGIMDKKVERLRQRLLSFGEEGEHG